MSAFEGERRMSMFGGAALRKNQYSFAAADRFPSHMPIIRIFLIMSEDWQGNKLFMCYDAGWVSCDKSRTRGSGKA